MEKTHMARRFYNLKNGLLAVLKIEVFFKAATLLLVSPVLELVFRRGVMSNEPVFNGEMFLKLLSLPRILLFVVLFLGAALWCYFEISTLISAVYWCREGKRFGLADALKGSLSQMSVMRHFSVIPASLYYVLLLPLVHTGYVSSLVPRIDIPNFIFGEMQKTLIGRAGVIAVRLGYLALFAVLLLVPVAMAVKKLSFGKAVKQNFAWYRLMAWKDRAKIWAAFFLWLVLENQLIVHMQRKIMQNQDFNAAFFKYLVRSSAYRIGVIQWLVFNLLLCVGTVLILWAVLGILGRYKALPKVEPPEADTKPIKQALQTAAGTGGRVTAAGKRFWKSRKHKIRWFVFLALVVCAVAAEYFNSLPLVHRPWVIGHRGCVYEAENTVSAIRTASKKGADYAEIDVQLSKDGVPVVIHDESLWRLAGTFASVQELTAKELQALTISSNKKEDRIPTFEEVIRAAKETSEKIGLLVELKVTGGNGKELAEKVIKLAEQYDFGRQAIFMSLDYDSVSLVQEAHPEWWVGYCIYGSAGKISATVWKYDIDFLAVEESLVTNSFLDQARDQWLPVYIWTVDDTADMWNYLQMDVAGIITDVPDEARAVVDEYLEKNHNLYSYEGEGYPGA